MSVLLRGQHEAKTILLTGAGGCIGAALAETISTLRPRLLILLDHSEHNLHRIQMALADSPASIIPVLGDILDDSLLSELFERHRPQVIYHAAAFKHVPLMESNPIAAVHNNALGTWQLAEVAVRYGADQLLLISTDKAVNPRSIMGAAKRMAELVCSSIDGGKTKLNAIRLGNVLGSHGSVAPLFQEQISRGGPVTVTDPEATRYFLTLAETVDLILTAASLNGRSGIFVPKLSEPVRIVDLADRMIRETGREPGKNMQILFTGLRPGEKLSEELSYATETLQKTEEPRLYCVTNSAVEENFASFFQRLSESVHQRNLASVLEMIAELVPEYQPSETLLSLLKPSLA